jgi:hypothetical protein
MSNGRRTTLRDPLAERRAMLPAEAAPVESK